MASKNSDSPPKDTGDDGSGGSGSDSPPQSPTSDQSNGKVYKSGPLFVSSKGIGWTSWKKRWFILTNTSLVFFRSDPKAAPQKGSELNLTLGGIDLNNSGSVVVKADKKLLTVLFPDGGREGRAFTLKADTLEDLYEWKEALENALAEAPNADIAMGQQESDDSSEQTKDGQPAKSKVIGRPILYALEEVDGSPSFLEKALKFIEGDGVRVEGILRQAADVEHVERRIREYEQGKTEFSAEEDAHVIADCIKYIIRELPSYPVPTSCCTALVEACRKTGGSDRKTRANAMRAVICETFPEPNRRFLQRILIMMQIVASHKNENLMAPPAVAACMAPLLLRPLLIGDCEIENDFDVGGGGSSMQLMQAAAGANHAQAIVITLLEEYNKIFGEGSISSELYDSDESGSEGEEATDDDESYDDDGTGESDAYTDDEVEIEDGSYSGSYDSGDENSNGEKDLDESGSGSKSPEVHDDHKARQKLSSSTLKIKSLRRHGDVQEHETVPDRVNNIPEKKRDDSAKNNNIPVDRSSVNKSHGHNQIPMMHKSTTLNERAGDNQRPAGWGRAHGKKNHSMESIDFNLEEEYDFQNLEATKADLQNRVSKEVKGNETLQAGLDKRKKSLDEDRLDLVQEVAKLQKQLVKEKNKRIALEAVLKNPLGSIPNLSILDEKTKAEIQELVRAESDVAKLKHKVDDLGEKLKHEQTYSSNDNEAPNTQHHEKSTKGTSDLPSRSSKAGKPPVKTNQKKSRTKGEGGSSTSALSKFTTRLNFLK